MQDLGECFVAPALDVAAPQQAPQTVAWMRWRRCDQLFDGRLAAQFEHLRIAAGELGQLSKSKSGVCAGVMDNPCTKGV